MPNDMTKIIERVEALAADAPEPRELYWLVIADEVYPFVYYCDGCARRLTRWMQSIALIPPHRRGVACLQTGLAEPRRWGDHGSPDVPYQTDPQDIYHSNDIGDPGEYDNAERCGRCVCLLEVWLSRYGVGQELNHFEAWSPEAPDEWREFLNVCQAVEGEAGELYDRTLAVARVALLGGDE